MERAQRDLAVQFGQRIRALRKQRGWTQEDLAERSGLHVTYISGVENGHRNATLQVIGRLAAAYGIAPAALFTFGEHGDEPSS